MTPSPHTPLPTPTPTGRLVRTADGYDLVLTRTFRAPVDDVWASVAEPERSARWFGAWRGEGGPGKTIEVQMAFEDGAPWCPMRIDACEPPYRLAVSMPGGTDEPQEADAPQAEVADGAGEAESWPMELLLSETDGTTELRLVHHRPTAEGLGEIGPGWEYYLDMLTAARDGAPLPDFDDYYPSQQAYFEALPPTPPAHAG
ncbi:ATPase [Streptomyces armeniacus]|uniref:ATPase n=1 Tax=Streptomyces armeniacus TaxID=83291 RepID=A0A345XT41_9ACTN|nr:SRPBCC family protein [Streptomyces armeniacus]AXK34807.1 ATPase [Streptomyces armeniacus]